MPRYAYFQCLVIMTLAILNASPLDQYVENICVVKYVKNPWYSAFVQILQTIIKNCSG